MSDIIYNIYLIRNRGRIVWVNCAASVIVFFINFNILNYLLILKYITSDIQA